MKNTYCEKLMWLATKSTIEKFMKAEFGDSDMRAFKKRFRNQYRQILSEVDDIGPFTKNPLRINLTGGVIWLAAYESCDGKMDEELFSKMITAIMCSRLYKAFYGSSNPFVMKKQCRKAENLKAANALTDSDYNWHSDYRVGRDENEYFNTYTRCGLCTLGKRRGHPELVPLMCQTDFISIDMMGGVLYRTQTLAMGGTCSDFHVVKKGSKWEV